jgi:hypothetical protein
MYFFSWKTHMLWEYVVAPFVVLAPLYILQWANYRAIVKNDWKLFYAFFGFAPAFLLYKMFSYIFHFIKNLLLG